MNAITTIKRIKCLINKQLLYFLLLIIANIVVLFIFNLIDAPKQYYMGASVLLAGVYGGFAARLPRKKKN